MSAIIKYFIYANIITIYIKSKLAVKFAFNNLSLYISLINIYDMKNDSLTSHRIAKIIQRNFKESSYYLCAAVASEIMETIEPETEKRQGDFTKKISPDECRREISRVERIIRGKYGLDFVALRGRDRRSHTSEARRVAAYLLHSGVRLSVHETGRILSRTASNVTISCQKVKGEMDVSVAYGKYIKSLIDKIWI